MRKTVALAVLSCFFLVGCSDPKKDCERKGGEYHSEFAYFLPVVVSYGKAGSSIMMVPQYRTWCDA